MGGDLDNRMTFLLETYYEIRNQVGEEFPVCLKLNSADFQRGGFTEEESMLVLKKMKEVGIDLIEISGGNYENPKMFEGNASESTKQREAYFLDYAQKARNLVDVPLVVTGGFRTEKGMIEAMESGAVDMVGIGKAFALNPDLPNEIINGTYETVKIRPIKTGIAYLDKKMSSMLELSWYEQQFARMGEGKNPNPNHNVWQTIGQMILNHGLAAFQKRRA